MSDRPRWSQNVANDLLTGDLDTLIITLKHQGINTDGLETTVHLRNLIIEVYDQTNGSSTAIDALLPQIIQESTKNKG